MQSTQPCNQPFLQTILTTITQLQTQTTTLQLLNNKLAHQLQTASQKKKKLIQHRNQKLQKLQNTLKIILTHITKHQQYTTKISNSITHTFDRAQSHKNNSIPIIIPHYNYTYIINNPQHLYTITQRNQQLLDKINKEKQIRDDKIRTLKIRISLAQIQLKQLKDRAKKV